MLASVPTQALRMPGQHRALCVTRRGAVPLRPLPQAARCSAAGGKAPRQPALPAAVQSLARSAAAAAAAALLLFGSVPASMAEIVTVTPQQATDMAKPLKKQEVNKGRIWLLFVFGATALFGSTVVLENNEAWFPAISRANKAVKAARRQTEQQEAAAATEKAQFEQRLAQVQQERQLDWQSEEAVLQGLREARQRIEASSSEPEAPGVGAAAAAAAVAVPAAEPAAAPAAEPAAAGEAQEPAPAAIQHSSTSEDASASSEAPSAAASGSGSNASGGSSSPMQDSRKPLFEISAEQIEASSTQRMQELQQELELRKTDPAAASAAKPAAAAGTGVQQEQ